MNISLNPTHEQFVISKIESRDLAEILDYFANINIEAGERFIQEFEKKYKNIANFPNMGRSYETVATGDSDRF